MKTCKSPSKLFLKPRANNDWYCSGHRSPPSLPSLALLISRGGASEFLRTNRNVSSLNFKKVVSFFWHKWKEGRIWHRIYRQANFSVFFSVFITAQKMKFSIKDFFRKCDQIRRKLRNWSHLLKKSLMKNSIFCPVHSGDWEKLKQVFIKLLSDELRSFFKRMLSFQKT